MQPSPSFFWVLPVPSTAPRPTSHMNVAHVPPFYNSKYDLSKWFQCSRSLARLLRYYYLLRFLHTAHLFALSASLLQRLRQFCYGRCFLNDIFFMHFTSAMHRIMCTLHILLSLPLFQHQHIGIQHSASLPTLQIACIHMLSTAIQPAQLAANSFNTGSKLEIFYVLGILHILFANR